MDVYKTNPDSSSSFCDKLQSLSSEFANMDPWF